MTETTSHITGRAALFALLCALVLLLAGPSAADAAITSSDHHDARGPHLSLRRPHRRLAGEPDD